MFSIKFFSSYLIFLLHILNFLRTMVEDVINSEKTVFESFAEDRESVRSFSLINQFVVSKLLGSLCVRWSLLILVCQGL